MGCAECPEERICQVPGGAVEYATSMDPNPYKSPEGADLAPPMGPDRLNNDLRSTELIGGLLIAVAVALMGFVLYLIA